jgi:hypothetical protein
MDALKKDSALLSTQTLKGKQLKHEMEFSL